MRKRKREKKKKDWWGLEQKSKRNKEKGGKYKVVLTYSSMAWIKYRMQFEAKREGIKGGREALWPGYAGGPINIFQSQTFAAHAHAWCVVQDKLAQFSPLVFNQANRVTDLRKDAGANYGRVCIFLHRRTMSDMVIHRYLMIMYYVSSAHNAKEMR